MRTLACCLVLTCVAAVEAAAPPAREADLPEGARLRLGTARLQFGYPGRPPYDPLVLSSDRKLLATLGPGMTADVFDLRTSRLLFRFQPPHEEIQFLAPLAFSHDGKMLAVSELSAGAFVSLWPLTKGARPKLLHASPLFESNGRLLAAAFLPGDKQLATYDGETLVVWDVAKVERVREDRLRSLEDAPTFSPDGRLFAAQIGDSVVLTDLVSGRWWRIALPTADDERTAVRWSWSNDGRFIALATTSNRLRIHDAKTGRLVRELPRSARSLPPTAFSPEGRALAVEAESGVLVYDVIRGKLQREIPIDLPPDSGLANLAYRDDNHLLVVDDWDFERTFDLRTTKEVLRPGHRVSATGLAFAADGRSLVSVDGSGRLLRWDLRTGLLSAIGAVSKGERRDWKLSLAANGHSALLGQQGASAELATFDVRRGFAGWRKKEWPVPGRRVVQGFAIWLADDTVTCSISPDARLVAAPRRATGQTKDSMVDEVVVLRPNGEKLWAFDSGFDPKQTFSPDSRELAISADQHDNTVVRLFDLHTGKVRLTLKAGQKETGASTALNFSPDGRLVVATDEDCLYVWERVTGQGIDRIALPKDFSVTQLVVKRDGRVLALGFLGWFPESHPTPRAIWDSTTAKPLLITSAFLAECPSRLSDDGRTLAVGCEDSSILLYDVPQPAEAKPTRLDGAEQRRLWADLSADASRAWCARQRLAAAPKEALALLSKHLKPAPARSIKELADLDADDFATREAATRALAASLKRGDRGAEAALRDLLASPPSLEPHLRARRLLAEAKPVPFTGEELRVIRAVGVLEQMADGSALALLKRLGQGGPSLLAAEARAALARLTKP